MNILTMQPTPPTRNDDWQGWIRYGLQWAARGSAAPAPARRRDTSDSRICPDPWGERWEGHASPQWTAADTASAPASSSPSGASSAASTTQAPDRRLAFVGYREDTPGERWRALFQATWPAYRAWYLSQGWEARPTLAEAEARLREHMPELVDTWLALVARTGHDPVAARLLTMWHLPLFATGCSQVVITGESPRLVRNYDYDPNLFEGVVASTNYSGRRKVIGTSDLLWGLVDGMNEDGLTVSLTYGGLPTGPDAPAGFAVPLVVRYLLETCATVPEAIAALKRLPVAQSYNLALLDTHGAHAAVFVGPGREPEVSDLRVTTNHRLGAVERPDVAGPLESKERQDLLLGALDEPADEQVARFTREPVRRQDYARGFGTLYTAEYRPAEGTLTYHWPDATWRRGFDDGEAEVEVWVRQNH